MKDYKYDKITPTADLISYFRTFSDIPYTKEIAEITGAEEIARKILGEHFKDSMFLAPISEVRYKRIDIQAQKYKNILEVAVGRSPRDLIFTENPEISYVATDLSDSLNNHETIIKELMARHKLKRPNLYFASVNALESVDFNKASDLLPEGPVAIISEGFMVYLSKEEKQIFLKNVLEILIKRGGCLITSDINFTKRSNIAAGIMDSISSTAGRDMRDLSFDNAEDAKNFLSEAGFDSEIVSDPIDVVSVKELKLENDPQTERVMSFPVWVLTPRK
ncbi:MAG: hypothetical protein HY225_02280 [Candidatus Vogelbacteria bacterium]|nr:hypothetical protein [Candidatus Vogelbacteria bacterium]